MIEELSQLDSTGWNNLPENWPDSLRRVLAARGITDESDLLYALADLPAPQQLMGMDDAVLVLATAIQQQQKIMIVADFDADGATSCTVVIRGLQAMGAQAVAYIVPSRFIHGYGLTPELLADIPLQDQPDVLMTVDNGMSSVEGVAAANIRGMQVVVTDHHLPGKSVPEAAAIVNPNQAGDRFPSKNLAGVGVCFYVLLGLRTYLREQGWFEKQSITEPRLTDLLDLVALGTVADVVPLDKLNRTFVQLGLARMRRGQVGAGLQELLNVAGKSLAELSASDLGFAIAPRLNAAGRLEDMRLGIDTLLSDDVAVAQSSAIQLDDLNKQRRVVEQNMQQQAQTMLDAMPKLQQDEAQPLGYCLFDESWHQGVVGLLASRIKTQQHRPVIAFARGDKGEVKGSARSVEGVHIRDVLAAMASQAPDMLSRFGGHSMAAGMTLLEQDLPRFEALFLQVLAERVSPETLLQKTITDGTLTGTELTLPLADTLSQFVPWGQGFTAPLFQGVFTVVAWRLVGQDQNHLRLQLQHPEQTVSITAMAFGEIRPTWLETGGEVFVCYRISVNTFRGERNLQLLVENLFPATAMED